MENAGPVLNSTSMCDGALAALLGSAMPDSGANSPAAAFGDLLSELIGPAAPISTTEIQEPVGKPFVGPDDRLQHQEKLAKLPKPVEMVWPGTVNLVFTANPLNVSKELENGSRARPNAVSTETPLL